MPTNNPVDPNSVPRHAQTAPARPQAQYPGQPPAPPRRRKSVLGKVFLWLGLAAVAGCLLIAAEGVYLYATINPELPEVESLRTVQLQVPLRVYTAEGDLIAEYGEKRRQPVAIESVPDVLKQAIVASEDAHFYEHPGVSWQGLVRAGVHLLKTGKKGPGGSTITMQVARNFFLSTEKTYSRKLNEILLALKIESELSKDEILSLYINKIYLGNRSYGFAAAANVYYDKSIANLELHEAAMLAGLPKAPSRYNPVVNPDRAKLRRDYVLRRMNEEGFITAAEYRDTLAMDDTASLHFSKPDVEAHYVGEMARARVKQLYGDAWSTAGLGVYTSIRSADQEAANAALRGALFAYEERRGYQGALDNLPAAVYTDQEKLAEALQPYSSYGGLVVAVSVLVSDIDVVFRTAEGDDHTVVLEDLLWARERLPKDELGDEITRVTQVLREGDVVYLWQRADDKYVMVQEPSVEGAFVAMEPSSGQINALVGGFDFRRSKFNRVTQAKRQPGSTFKPFIYSAALEKGDTAATIYNDAPVVFHDDALEGEWRPSNYSGRFFGPTRLREALVKSRNLVSVRVLREIGIPYAIEYATRFGFAESAMPPDLSLALGSASVTPLEVASGFAVFANNGYRIQPHFIDRIVDADGNVVYRSPEIELCDECDATQVSPLLAEMTPSRGGSAGVSGADADGSELEAVHTSLKASATSVTAPRVIEARNAYIMRSMLKEVVTRGTARKANSLERSDLAGKTGTTNNQLDAWFTGFNHAVVASAWVGSDGLEPLGRKEAGGVAALPMWIDYMGMVLPSVPEQKDTAPEGIKVVTIDRETGDAADRGDSGTLKEFFRAENAPANVQISQVRSGNGSAAPVIKKRERKKTKRKVDQLF